MYVPRSTRPLMTQQDPSPLRFAGVGVELAGVVVGMALLGYGIDRWLGTPPWGVVIGSTLGIAGGLYNVVKNVTRESDDDDASDGS